MPLVTALPSSLQHIHIMGIGGTAMAALAGMLVDAGYTVTGSDGNQIYPPMSDYLADLGIQPMVGYQPENLTATGKKPDLVVVGNVVREIYPEAQALLQTEIPYMSFPALIGAGFLNRTHNIVVSGTHGKTTTTTIIQWLLEAAGRSPGFLVGGVPGNFTRTARPCPSLEQQENASTPYFVIEGDEYDTAFFDKGPKFLHYRPSTVILTSIEFDHADIYRDLEHCKSSFQQLMHIVPKDGVVVARWDDPAVAQVASEAKCTILRYGPDQQWDGRIESIDPEKGTMHFSVLCEGICIGTFESNMVGEHNLYNQVAAVAALHHQGIEVDLLAKGFQSYRGVKRRQEVIGEIGGVTVIDDFAHHPTAVRLTLQALRMRFGGRRIWGIFEPRSNTSRRNVFQAEYADAFAIPAYGDSGTNSADIIVIAPPQNLDRIPPSERFDARLLVDTLRGRGVESFLWGDLDSATPEQIAEVIASQIATNVMPKDVVAILSNGGFGGLHHRLMDKLKTRFAAPSRGMTTSTPSSPTLST